MPLPVSRVLLANGHIRWRRAIATVAAALSAAVLAPGSALAAGVNVNSAPEWFPLRGDHLIGCTYNGTGGVCGGDYHPYWALDIKATKGEAVYAAGAGKVTRAVVDQGGNCSIRIYSAPTRCPDGSRGNSVLIEHGAGLFSYYQHMTSVTVKTGDWVDQNTVLGAAGDSGYSTSGFYHLHFERRGTAAGSQQDPGSLKGCVGSALRLYPRDLTPAGAPTSWQGLPTERYTARSGGSACTIPPGGGSGSGPGGKPKVDLVFAIDTTGSMGSYISAVKISARAIATTLLAGADARVALVDYKDLYACASDGYAARVDLPFSTDAAAFSAAVGTLSAAGGCDTPESVYSAIMTSLGLPWRSGATKAVLVMGDAPPHDPEPVTGFTRASVAAAAKSVSVVTTGPGLARASVEADAEAMEAASIYSININGGASPYFEDLAADSDGKTYIASDPSTAVDQITEAIATITNGVLTLDAGGPYSGAVGEPVTFTAAVVGLPDIAVPSYGWDLDGNGIYEHRTTLPTISRRFTAPYSGPIGVAVWTEADTSGPPAATATARTNILKPTTTRYRGLRIGLRGQRVALRALVTTTTKTPRGGVRATPSAGVRVTFTLGDDTRGGPDTCKATTTADGVALCRVVISRPPGVWAVSAVAGPTVSLFSSADAAPFRVVGFSHDRGKDDD